VHASPSSVNKGTRLKSHHETGSPITTRLHGNQGSSSAGRLTLLTDLMKRKL